MPQSGVSGSVTADPTQKKRVDKKKYLPTRCWRRSDDFLEYFLSVVGVPSGVEM